MIDSFPKLKRMSALQERVYELGVCPECHAKTLVEVGVFGEFRTVQCVECRGIFIGQLRELDS